MFLEIVDNLKWKMRIRIMTYSEIHPNLTEAFLEVYEMILETLFLNIGHLHLLTNAYKLLKKFKLLHFSVTHMN